MSNPLRFTVVEISDEAWAKVQPYTDEEVEFRELFGRWPEPSDVALGLGRVLEIQRGINSLHNMARIRNLLDSLTGEASHP